jgi:FlaA1/EpsC-like NDP-sugar epimerase
VQYAAMKHDRNFVSVRFGNVLGGEVFLLDMGEPIRIVDIATDLIGLPA